jgi:hypothetical protein
LLVAITGGGQKHPITARKAPSSHITEISPPLFRSDTDYTPSGDELTYSPFTSTDDTSTTTTLTLMTNTTYSSDTNDHSIESSTTYLGLFKDDSDINIFSDDSHSDNTNISLLAYKPFEDS